MVLEELDIPLMFSCSIYAVKRAEVSPFVGLRVYGSRIYPVFARFQFAYHNVIIFIQLWYKNIMPPNKIEHLTSGAGG